MLTALSPLVSLSDMTGPNADTKETDTMKTDISRFFTVCYIFFGTFFFAICLSLYSDMMFAMRESLDDHASEHASKRDADEIEGSTAHERRHRKKMKDSKIKVAWLPKRVQRAAGNVRRRGVRVRGGVERR